MPASLLTASEVAAILRVSENTLAKWRCCGGGPAYVKVGGVRYPAVELEQWVQSRLRRSDANTGKRRTLVLAVPGTRTKLQRGNRLGGYRTKQDRRIEAGSGSQAAGDVGAGASTQPRNPAVQ